MASAPLSLDRAALRALGVVCSVLAMGGAGLLAACGDGGSGDLLGAHGSTPGTSVGGQTSDSGVQPIVDAGPLTEAGVLHDQAETMFRALEADLVGGCGGTGGVCHVTGAYQNNQTPVWLANPDAYASIKAYPGIIVSDPYSSKLIIKGPHEGPGFSGDLKNLGDRVMAWLTVEALAIKATALPTTDAIAIVAGPNSIDISKAGTGITGAKITFNASITGSILTLSSLSVVAPATSGIHVVHPIFQLVPTAGDAKPDPVDSFSNVDQTDPPGSIIPLGPGALLLENWDPSDKLSIAFTKLEAGTVIGGGDGGTTGGGCKDPTGFTTNAVPQIQANGCLGCHGDSGGSGYGSLDLSQVGKNDALACAQALTKVNTANKAQSAIILAPTGGIAAHPYKGAGQAYTTAMLAWINNE